MSGKPNCYECIHRGTLAGDCHSRCKHPLAGGGDPMNEVMAIFASVRRVKPVVNVDGAVRLKVSGNPHGIRKGWFNWPYNFDPVWLTSCDGFTPKETTR